MIVHQSAVQNGTLNCQFRQDELMRVQPLASNQNASCQEKATDPADMLVKTFCPNDLDEIICKTKCSYRLGRPPLRHRPLSSQGHC